ncbi:MAG: BMP family ABC transporter substrate-binding protein [Lachnospiraceae bacterium]|nr:BMP family ABC transporter substrate-binding protein [Lachnospiraceae bacterium]
MAVTVATNAEALKEYEKACRLGKKEGLPMIALDNILKEKKIQTPKEIPLGLVQIPMNQIVGTKTVGRSSAFSQSFYPLIKINSEFSTKWCNLYLAHLQEGIREPVKAYEFMNKFYIEEGNKRVSVLKYFDAVSVPGYVTRIIPPWSEDPEVRTYYAFMDFYNLSGVNYIWFSHEESFAKLQQLMGKRPDEVWDEDTRLTFSSVYSRFESEYEANGGGKLPITTGDAFLFFIELYDYDTLDGMTTAELNEKIVKTWNEFKLLITDETLELQMDPSEDGEVKKNIFARLIPISTPKVHVAFIHEKTAETSGWTYSHELGRMHLQETFNDQISTTCYDQVTEETADEVLEKAIAEGNNLIFTTTPPLLKASLKAAIEHPEVKILNCSLNNTHKNIRTYYARMYEAKFLQGAIGGAMSKSGNIGYIADYPIYGMIANINAFALGAKMVNPRAKIYLEWSTIKDHDMFETFAEHNVGIISGPDISVPGDASRHFGLYRATDHTPLNLAMPIWHWGKFYEQMIRKIMSGAFKYDETSDETKGLNYWWGMSAGIIDVICSHHLPIGTARLVDLLKKNICEYALNPFSGILFSQDGVVKNSADNIMSPEEIVKMDWLAENVIGIIPKKKILVEDAKPVVQTQGLENQKLKTGV